MPIRNFGINVTRMSQVRALAPEQMHTDILGSVALLWTVFSICLAQSKTSMDNLLERVKIFISVENGALNKSVFEINKSLRKQEIIALGIALAGSTNSLAQDKYKILKKFKDKNEIYEILSTVTVIFIILTTLVSSLSFFGINENDFKIFSQTFFIVSLACSLVLFFYSEFANEIELRPLILSNNV